jgi:ABC-type multidrug transport system fused ATPase/permease subunit
MAMPDDKPSPGGYALMRDLCVRRPRLMVIIIALAFLGPLVTAPTPYLGKIIIDDLIFRQQAGATAGVNAVFGVSTTVWMLAGIVGLGVLLKLLGTIIGGWHSHFILQITRNGLYDVRVGGAERVMGVPMRELESLSPGKVASRLTNDPNHVDGAIFTILRNCLTAIFTVLVVVGFMLFLDPLLTVVVLATMPFTALLSISWYRRLREFSREESDRSVMLSATATETFGAIKVIRAFTAEAFFLRRIRERSEALRYEGIRHWTVYHMIAGLLGLLTSLGADIFLFVGGVLAIQGKISFGEFFAFAGYQAMLWGPINTLLTTGQTMQIGAASADKLSELLASKQEPHIERPAQPAPERFRGEVVAEGLRFSYDGQEDVLRDIDLVIKPGTMTALVGQSGSGKTTFATMILGMYLPTGGKLLVDGTDVRQWDLRRLREQVGVVLQDSLMFDDTVRANLCMGMEGVGEERLWGALRAAHLEDAVRAMPQGLETRLGQSGTRLSGGQRQRLAIARVFLRDPRLIILDEATSALDSETERQIQRSFDALMVGRTSVVIAHRLSTIFRADQIVVMHAGRVAEVGTHEELLKKNDGRYRDLFQAQIEGMLPMSGATRHHKGPA